MSCQDTLKLTLEIFSDITDKSAHRRRRKVMAIKEKYLVSVVGFSQATVSYIRDVVIPLLEGLGLEVVSPRESPTEELVELPTVISGPEECTPGLDGIKSAAQTWDTAVPAEVLRRDENKLTILVNWPDRVEEITYEVNDAEVEILSTVEWGRYLQVGGDRWLFLPKYIAAAVNHEKWNSYDELAESNDLLPVG
jgi:hypothetical protein